VKRVVNRSHHWRENVRTAGISLTTQKVQQTLCTLFGKTF